MYVEYDTIDLHCIFHTALLEGEFWEICCCHSRQWRRPQRLQLNVQGVSRLVSQVTHPFSWTYVDAAGCPLTIKGLMHKLMQKD